MTFELDPRFAVEKHAADWPLCRVMVTNDARYPWLVLVPRRNGVTEITQLETLDRAQLVDEIARAGRLVQNLPGVTKLNFGALGNLVPQLHIHVVGRHAGDPAWPGPVWGHSPGVPYDAGALERILAAVRAG